jgi:hypothetical protein
MPPIRTIFTCDICKRLVRPHDDEFWLWLVSWPPLASKLIVRCPQHISEWSLRQAGYPRTVKVRAWAKYAKENDPTPIRPVSEFVAPYPKDGPLWHDE